MPTTYVNRLVGHCSVTTSSMGMFINGNVNKGESVAANTVRISEFESKMDLCLSVWGRGDSNSHAL